MPQHLDAVQHGRVASIEDDAHSEPRHRLCRPRVLVHSGIVDLDDYSLALRRLALQQCGHHSLYEVQEDLVVRGPLDYPESNHMLHRHRADHVEGPGRTLLSPLAIP